MELISALKKYLFGIIVLTYVLSAVGIPVYLHYCGGELEQVNYLVKSNSCCGGEEDDSDKPMDCCKDENIILQNTSDFTLKQFHNYDLVKTFCDLFYVSLPFSAHVTAPISYSGNCLHEPFPPQCQQRLAVSITVLRI